MAQCKSAVNPLEAGSNTLSHYSPVRHATLRHFPGGLLGEPIGEWIARL